MATSLITWNKTRIRGEIGATKVGEFFTDRLTGALPKVWRAATMTFEGALFVDEALMDIAQIQTVTVTLRPSSRFGPDLAEAKTVEFADLNRGLTLEQWQAGEGEHFKVTFSDAEMNLGINQVTDKFWLVIHGYNTDSEVIINGATEITIVESGLGQNLVITPPAPPPAFYDSDEADSLFIHKAGDHFNGPLIADSGAELRGCPLLGRGTFQWQGNITMDRVADPSAAISGSEATTGTMAAGDYDYAVAYSDGTLETDVSATLVVSGVLLNTGVTLTGIPVSPNCLVGQRFIYRRVSGVGAFKYLDAIADNTTTTYTDDGSITPDSGHEPVDGGNFIGALTIDGNVDFADADANIRIRSGQLQLKDPDGGGTPWRSLVIEGGALALAAGEA